MCKSRTVQRLTQQVRFQEAPELGGTTAKICPDTSSESRFSGPDDVCKGRSSRHVSRGQGGPGTCPNSSLTSVELLAFRVNVLHIEDILKQDASHREGAAKAGAAAPGSKTHAKKAGEIAEELQRRSRTAQARRGPVAQPLPSPPPSWGIFTSAPTDRMEKPALCGRVSNAEDSAQGGESAGPTCRGGGASCGAPLPSSSAPSSESESWRLECVGA